MSRSTSIPFWSWNDKLEQNKLLQQIDWLNQNKFGGFIMHARSGLKTKYLGEEWFDCIRACCEYAEKLGMEAWAYDENGWPSGFVGGKLLQNKSFREHYLTSKIGSYDKNAFLHYDLDQEELCLTEDIETRNCLNIYNIESNSNVDILNDEVTDAFIENTHELYKKELGNLSEKIQGFFTDEPQYSRVGAPLPKKLQSYFIQEYQQDPIPLLGFLYVKKKGYREFRYRYWKSCQRLMLDNFAKKVYSWCDNNGIKLIGHYVEERDNFSQMIFNAGIMPFYEYLHYPGIDWLCRRYMNLCVIRQMASVAAQLDRKHTLSEMFAMTGWDVTPKELKNIADYQYLFGVNLMCHHLVPYSEGGERKRDHPTHFTPLNPWVDKGMAAFNDYFDDLGQWLRQGKESVRIGVLHTIRSAYFDYQPHDPSSTMKLDSSLNDTSSLLAEHHLAFHFIDETLLKKYGAVEQGQLKCGACKYDCLVFPRIYTMDKSTEKLLREFVKQGGKVLLTEDKPTYLEGQPYDYDYLQSNVTLDELVQTNPYTIEADGELFTALYEMDGKKYIFAVNKGSQAVHLKATCGEEVVSGEYNVKKNQIEYLGENIMIKPYSSKILCSCEVNPSAVNEYEIIEIGDGEYQYCNCSGNYLTLDYARRSFDGINYGEMLPIMGIFQDLLQKRYCGDVYLKTNFELHCKPENLQLMVEDPDNIEVFINGNKLVFTETNEKESHLKYGSILPFVKIGINEIVCKYHFFQKEEVYFALFGENVGESLRNCLVYDTNIENMYLYGDFGVYSDSFKKGEMKDVFLANDFYLDTYSPKVQNLVTDGFPFFSGRITLKRLFNCVGGQTKLRFYGRYHYFEVYINGQKAGTVMFDDELDVSSFVNSGENVLELVVYTGLRNLLGPHHERGVEENLLVSPNSFEKLKTWKDGKSEEYLDRYSFVRFGFFKE